MHILLTGGSGLLGGFITQALWNQETKFSLLTRNPGKLQIVRGSRAIIWDATSTAGWCERLDRLDKIDIVIHLAGENLAGTGFFPKRWSKKHQQRCIQSRITTGKLLVDYLAGLEAERRPSCFIQTSGLSYYQPQEINEIDETDAPGTGFLYEVCAQAEQATQGTCQQLGIRHIITRLAPVLYPTRAPLLQLAFATKLMLGAIPGDGSQMTNWLHPTDYTRIINAMIQDASYAGIYNLCAPKPISQEKFMRAIGKTLKRSIRLKLSKKIYQLLLGNAAALIFNSYPLIPHRLLQRQFQFQHTEIEPALASLLNPNE